MALNPFDLSNKMLEKGTSEVDFLYYTYLQMIALNMFEYENLPDSIDEFYLEFILQTRGYIIFVDDPEVGLVALETTLGGKINHYYLPTSYQGVDVSGTLNKVYDADDVVLMKNSPLYLPLTPFLDYYAKEIALCSRTIDVNLDAQWTPYIVAGDKRMKGQFDNFMKKIKSGIKTIFTWKNFDLGAIQILPTQAPFVSGDVNIIKQSIIRECMTVLGIDNANMDKRERVQTAEVHSNNSQIIASRNIWLAERKKALKKFNEKFNKDVSVKFRAYEDILDLIEVNENGIDEMGGVSDE